MKWLIGIASLVNLVNLNAQCDCLSIDPIFDRLFCTDETLIIRYKVNKQSQNCNPSYEVQLQKFTNSDSDWCPATDFTWNSNDQTFTKNNMEEADQDQYRIVLFIDDVTDDCDNNDGCLTSNEFYLTYEKDKIEVILSYADSDKQFLSCNESYIDIEARINHSDIRRSNGTSNPSANFRAEDLNLTWTGDGIETIPGMPTNKRRVTKPGLFGVKINKCSANKMSNIDVSQEIPQIDTMPLNPKITCQENEFTLKAEFSCIGCQGGTTVTWKRGQDVLPTTRIDDIAQTIINTPGEYTFLITNSKSNCSDSSTVLVTEDTQNSPIANISANEGTEITCDKMSISLNGNSSTGVGNLTYNWIKPNNTTSNSNNISINSPGFYKLIVEDANGCISSPDTIEITTNKKKPDIDISPTGNIGNNSNRYQFCENDDLELAIMSMEGDSIFWNDVLGNKITLSKSDFSKTEEFITYTAKVKNSNNGCISENVVQVKVNEAIDLSSIQPTYDSNNQNRIIINKTINDWKWEILERGNVTGGPTSSTGTGNINHVFNTDSERSTGTIVYKIVGVNGACIDSTLIPATIFPSKPFIAEVYSPNQDGINDTWNIIFTDDAANYRVRVYNRAGGLVFESDGYMQPWDGTGCTQGTYYYIIEGKSGSEQCPSGCKGAVTIIGKSN